MQCYFEHFGPSFHKHSLNIFEYSWTFTNILNKLQIVQSGEESKSYGDSCRCWYEQEYKWKNLSNSTSGIFKDRCYVENLITFFLLCYIIELTDFFLSDIIVFIVKKTVKLLDIPLHSAQAEHQWGRTVYINICLQKHQICTWSTLRLYVHKVQWDSMYIKYIETLCT